jgi:WD40 repeat protein
MLLLLALYAVAPGANGSEPGSTPKKGARVDAFGDPLPPGAVRRIGTVRLRQPSEVCSVAFSPDGKLLATGGRYDGVRLWDASTGKALHFLPARGAQGIFGLAFSPDSKTLVSSGTDGALEAWDVATGKRASRLLGGPVRLGPLCFSDDGKLLAAAGGKTIRVWDTAGWTERALPRPESGKIVLTSFAGKRMYVGEERGTSYLWDLASLERRTVPQGWRDGYGTALSPDGKQMAVADGETALVVLRDVASGEEVQRLRLKGGKDASVKCLCFSPQGKLLAVAGRGIRMRCINCQTGKEVARFGEQEVDYATQLAFSSDGRRLAAAWGHGVRLWDVGTGKEILPTSELLHDVHAVAFSPDGMRLAFGDGTWLRLYDLAAGKAVWRCPEDRDSAQRIAFAPDCKTLVAGDVSRLRFHDELTGKVMHTWGEGLDEVFSPRDSIELGLFTPDLEKVVSLHIAPFRDPNTDVLVRSAKTGKVLLRFQRIRGAATAACISPDGQLLAIGDREGPTRLYHTASGKSAGQLDVGGTDCHRLTFAPDGRTVASLDPEGPLRLLEVATGKTRLVLPGVKARDEFVYSPDGKLLATWADNTVELRDALTGRKVGRLQGHTGRVTQAAFAPGGAILATAGEDTTILLWELPPGRGEKPTAVRPEVLASAWEDLADPDAANAYRAMASFRGAGSQAVAFLRGYLRPEQMPAEKQIDRWLKDLDHADFPVREVASSQLRKHVDVVAPALRKALADNPPLEVHRRLSQLIEQAEQGRWAPDSLRVLRAIEVLEQVGSPEARAVLATLASGAPQARLTMQARGSLERLAR